MSKSKQSQREHAIKEIIETEKKFQQNIQDLRTVSQNF